MRAGAIMTGAPRASLVALAGALVGLGGCLSVPDGPAAMCQTTDDCDHASGEVCEQGVCWGNPPAGPFAAVLSPASTRHDLVPRELAQVAIPADGYLGDLALAKSVLMGGRVTAYCAPPTTDCDALGASITVTRSSQFHGGPGFKAVVNVDAADGFSIPVPPTEDGDDPYVLTIVPDSTAGSSGSTGGTGAVATSVPPRRMQLSLADSMPDSMIVLGGPGLPVINGSLTDSLGQGLAGYRVVAIGRWDPSEPVTEVSSVSLTDASGAYTVTLSDQLVGTVEVVATPPAGQLGGANNALGPTIHLANFDATKSAQRSAVAPVTLGTELPPITVAVTGVVTGGTVSPIAGATVIVTGGATSMLTSFTVADTEVTGNDGTVQLRLLGGPDLVGTYRISIIPQASSQLGVIYNQKFTPPAAGATLPPIRLGARLALQGTIVDAAGAPVIGAVVTAQPSLRFLWTLDAAPQAFAGAIPPSTTTNATDMSGGFVVWVDANIDQVWGEYDLLIQPPADSRAPSLVQTVDLLRDATIDTMPLGTITLPDAAFVHGRVVDSGGTPVEDAEIKLYRVSTALELCSEVAHAPTTCPIPAALLDRNTSDDDGMIRLALARQPTP
jgi:hypothetical protein